MTVPAGVRKQRATRRNAHYQEVLLNRRLCHCGRLIGQLRHCQRLLWQYQTSISELGSVSPRDLRTTVLSDTMGKAPSL
jgi:hypothetical protein